MFVRKSLLISWVVPYFNSVLQFCQLCKNYVSVSIKLSSQAELRLSSVLSTFYSALHLVLKNIFVIKDFRIAKMVLRLLLSTLILLFYPGLLQAYDTIVKIKLQEYGLDELVNSSNQYQVENLINSTNTTLGCEIAVSIEFPLFNLQIVQPYFSICGAVPKHSTKRINAVSAPAIFPVSSKRFVCGRAILPAPGILDKPAGRSGSRLQSRRNFSDYGSNSDKSIASDPVPFRRKKRWACGFCRSIKHLRGNTSKPRAYR